MVPFQSLGWVYGFLFAFYSRPITVAVSVAVGDKMFDAGKTRMIGLPYGEKNYDDMLSRFHTIPACHRHGRTDRRTDRIAVSISRVTASVF